MEIERFNQVKQAHKYGGDPEAVAKMLQNLPSDYIPNEIDEAKYLKKEETRKQLEIKRKSSQETLQEVPS